MIVSIEELKGYCSIDQLFFDGVRWGGRGLFHLRFRVPFNQRFPSTNVPRHEESDIELLEDDQDVVVEESLAVRTIGLFAGRARCGGGI